MLRSLSLPSRFGTLALALTIGALLAATTACGAARIPDFTFIHASDIHAPMSQSAETLSKIADLGDVEMTAYGVTVPKPSFAIATGDLDEFGSGGTYGTEYLSYWKSAGIPVWHVLGNHDNTWHAGVKLLRDLGQGPYYSFDRNGCHFVGLMTPTIQDPRPSISEEQLNWLRMDLRHIGKDVPVFVFFHHPLGGSEFASRYDYDRLLDILRDYNTVLLMSGHSHGYVYRPLEGWDQVTGGSTFGPNAGLMFVSVKDGILRAAYRKATDPTPSIKILEKPIPRTCPYPTVEIALPKPRCVATGSLAVSARVCGSEAIQKATYSIDGQVAGDLGLSGSAPTWTATGTVDISKLTPGAHYLRVDFEDGDRHNARSTEFFCEPASQPTAWRVYLGASGKASPTIADGVLYVATQDGRLTALNTSRGTRLWIADTGAEVIAQPLVANGMIYVANGMGRLTAYSMEGKPQWSFTADDSIYSAPIEVDGKIVFGCNSGKLYAVDAKTGCQVWANQDAGYAVESKPFAADGRVYYGAWDQYIRCVDAATGRKLWQQLGEGSRVEKAARYYSPADCGPVVAGGNVLVADRDYYLTILKADTGERVTAIKGVAAVGLSDDGAHIYLRKTAGDLAKIDPAGNQLWSVPAQLGFLPAPPVEKDGVVYVTSATGLVSAVSAEWGKVLWQYQASPQLFVMAPVAADASTAYVLAFDGHLTAIKRDQREATASGPK